MIEDSILNGKQSNNGVVNVHRYTLGNVGDLYAGPHHYFDELKGKQVDILGFRKISKKKRLDWISKINDNALVIGGGGLLNIRHFERQMKLFEELKAKGKKTVIWGAGHNQRDLSKYQNNTVYNINPSNFGIVGTRDYSAKTEWVPCVSCLHPIFDRKFTVNKEVGVIYCNKTSKRKDLLQYFKDFPSTSNTTDLEEMVNFIGSSDTIITDSYHAMYWGILLNKKTVVIPTTSKFYDFKYKSVISDYENYREDIKKAQRYSGVLEECREINRNFATKVFDYLNI
ncbi:polysaccharide pyruvyl transferase family protein [Mesonia sp. K7]|uniref:polysaccharide pyruvyl transferase family protein n=1 Tax=Mesonia sp. K7 TaxID=2218606 RepID=UPI001314877F|nr:polysaccharide pyruvyl transferase family protein [Mesonia sp. K7]